MDLTEIHTELWKKNGDYQKVNKCITTLTAVMELVEEVARACCLDYSKESYPNSTENMLSHIVDKDWEWYKSEARAALATIKGEKKVSDLKPCPFCGGEASITCIEGDNYVFCDEHKNKRLKCRVAPCTESFALMQEAIKAWNTRACEQRIVELEEVLNFVYDDLKIRSQFHDGVFQCSDSAVYKMRKALNKGE